MVYSGQYNLPLKLHKLCLNILPPNLRRFEFIHLKLDLTIKFITDVINLTFFMLKVYTYMYTYTFRLELLLTDY